MKRFFTEPLTHFLLIGGLFFLVFEVFSTPGDELDKTITITAAQVETIRAGFTRTWQRPPTEEELENLVKDKVRDEIACREALAMGLDKDDAYIRRRLRLKMDLMLEDMSALVPPTDEELATFLELNREKFRIEPKVKFSHVYMDVEKHGSTLQRDEQILLEQLAKAGRDADLKRFGDPTILPESFPLSPSSVVDRQFGKNFSEQLAKQMVGKWQGPISSGYGHHLVLVHEYIPGRDPGLEEIRETVEREFMAKRRKEIKQKTYEKLMEGYKIVIKTEVGEGNDRG